MLDFRIGSRKGAKNLPIKPKRSGANCGLPNIVKKTPSNIGLVKGAAITSDVDKTDESPQGQEPDLAYVFNPNKMPKQKQMFYQYCDLHDSEIQELVSRNDGQVEGGLLSAQFLVFPHENRRQGLFSSDCSRMKPYAVCFAKAQCGSRVLV